MEAHTEFSSSANVASLNWLPELELEIDDLFLTEKSLDVFLGSSFAHRGPTSNVYQAGKHSLACHDLTSACRSSVSLQKRTASEIDSCQSTTLNPSSGYKRPAKSSILDSWDPSHESEACLGEVASFSGSPPSSKHSREQIVAFEEQLAFWDKPQAHALSGLVAPVPRIKNHVFQNTTSGGTVCFGLHRPASGITDVQPTVRHGRTKTQRDSPACSIHSDNNKWQGTHIRDENPLRRRNGPNAQDHILAERKRREKLNQRFIALSAILPGLKRMDKASVLDDAIKYVKSLQERLKLIEDKSQKMVSVAVQEQSKGSNDGIGDEKEKENPPAHGIEVRVIQSNVFVRVHCLKSKSVIVSLLLELEKLQLNVMNANIISFSEITLDVTLTAQMEEGCGLTADDILRTLQTFFDRLKMLQGGF